MRDRAEVVVVGAGIMGLSIAYHLARRGVTNVTVVDRSYLCGGASGRNGGGVRAQWSSEANVRLMHESIRMCREFATQMKITLSCDHRAVDGALGAELISEIKRFIESPTAMLV